jgi:transposase
MIAKRNGYPETTLNSIQKEPEYFSIAELAERWRCSRGTVYNRLRKVRADVLDFAPRGRKGKKLVPAATVFGIEARHTRRLC